MNQKDVIKCEEFSPNILDVVPYMSKINYYKLLSTAN